MNATSTLTSTKHRRYPRGIVYAISVVAISFSLVLASALPSLAFGSDTSDDSGGTVNPNDPPLGGGGGGGGGGATAWKYVTYSYEAESSIIQGCAAFDSRGEPVLGNTATWRYPTNLSAGEVVAAIKGGNGASVGVTRVSLNCQYPPAFNWKTYKVIVGSTARVEMIIPKSELLGTASMSTSWGRGDHSLSSLYNSNYSSASASIDVKELGRYAAYANTTAQWVTVKNYISASYPDQIASIGNAWVSDSSSREGQLTCAGWDDSWVGSPTWTFTDCGPAATPTPTYQCIAAGTSPAVTVDGITSNSAVLFRDGSEHVVKWDVISPSSELSVTGASTRWTRSGTPWRENGLSVSQANVSLAPNADGSSIFNSDSGTSWVAGVKDSAYVKGFWASTANQPTLIHPQWNYSGTMTVQSVVITGLDSNGAWVVTSNPTTVDSSGVCSAADASINYVRATGQ